MKGLAWVGVFVAIGVAVGATGFALTPVHYRAFTAFEMKSVGEGRGRRWWRTADLDSPMGSALSEERMEQLIQELDLYKEEREAGRPADAMLDLRASTSLFRDLWSLAADRWVVGFEASNPSTAARVSSRMASLIKAEADRISPINDVPLRAFEVTILETTVLDERFRPAFSPFAVAGVAAGLVAGVVTLPLFVWWRRRRPVPTATVAVRRWSRMELSIAWTLAGVLSGLVVYVSTPRTYRASSTIHVVPPEVRPPGSVRRPIGRDELLENLHEVFQQVLPEARLEFIVRDFGLYRQERRGMLMTDDVVEHMRRDIAIDVPLVPESATAINFTVSFQCSDPATAMRVTSELATALVDEPAPYYGRERDQYMERRSVIEAPRVPEEPVSPRLLPHLAVGALAGFSIGLVLSFWTFSRGQ